MSTRIIRTLALAVGAGALVLGTAAPAMAADTFTNDTLPGKTVAHADQSSPLTVNLTTPEGYDCTKWTVRKVGQKRATEQRDRHADDHGRRDLHQRDGRALHREHPANSAKKGNAVIKFVGTNADGTMTMVENLVVKLNPGAKPTKGGATITPSAA